MIKIKSRNAVTIEHLLYKPRFKGLSFRTCKQYNYKDIVKDKDSVLSFLNDFKPQDRIIDTLAKYVNTTESKLFGSIKYRAGIDYLMTGTDRQIDLVEITDLQQRIDYLASYFESIGLTVYINTVINMHRIDLVVSNSTRNIENVMLHFDSKSRRTKTLNLMKDPQFKDLIVVREEDFSDAINLQKLKHKVCYMLAKEIPIVEFDDTISKVDNKSIILNTLNMYHSCSKINVLTKSFFNYLYSKLLDDSIWRSVKRELSFMEDIIDNGSPEAILKCTEQLCKIQNNIHPLVSTINKQITRQWKKPYIKPRKKRVSRHKNKKRRF